MISLQTIAILGLLSFCIAQNIPPCVVQCQIGGGCPDRSTCRNVSPDGTTPRYVCICDDPTTTTCTSTNTGGSTFSCGNRTSVPSSCGTRFPNGCPTGTSCVSLSTSNERTCVCNTPGAVLNYDTLTCVLPCPPNSVRNTNGVCQCIAPYVRDTTVNELRCILPNTATCTNVQCSLNYHCEIASSGGPVCVPNPNTQVCGVDFRCPSPYECIDTSSGPRCRCPEGFAGPGCAFRRCWTLTSSNELGCWSYDNGTATCIVSTTDVAFCQCAQNLIPPNCVPSVPNCDNVNCNAIANSQCINGRCICRDGYIAVPSTTTQNSYTCRPIGSCNCTGNKVCDSTGNCVCPADQFGGSDCSRPACSTNEDCTAAGLLHSYCVTNTNTGIRGFCVCSPGYSGVRCDIPTNNCDPTRCPSTNMVCNNEDRCVCAPGFNGTNCSRPIPPTCLTITIVVRASAASAITADQLRAVLAAFIGIDQALINVTGPISVNGNSSVVLFVIRICRDANTNEQSAGDQFVEDVNQGSAEQFGIQSATVGDLSSTTEQVSSNESTVVSFSILLLSAVAFLM